VAGVSGWCPGWRGWPVAPPPRRVIAGWGEMLDGTKQDVHERLIALTNGRGPDRCLDAVRAEAHAGDGVDAVPDKAKAATVRTVDRSTGLEIPPCFFVG